MMPSSNCTPLSTTVLPLLLFLVCFPTLLQLSSSSSSSSVFVRATVSSLPFREGYDLGSIVSEQAVREMIAETRTRRDLRSIDSAATEASSLLRDLRSVPSNPDDASELDAAESIEMDAELLKLRRQVVKTRTLLWKKKVTALERLTAILGESVDRIGSDASNDPHHHDPSGSGSLGQSPVRWAASPVISSPRGADSLHVHATYVDATRVNQTADATSLHANHVLGNLTDAFEDSSMPRHMMQNLMEQVAGKVKRFSDTNNVHSTLILTAFATHRNARHFDQVVFDKEALRTVWNRALNSSAVSDFTVPPAGGYHNDRFKLFVHRLEHDANFATRAAQLAPLHLITEVHLGSSLVGLVRFTKSTRTSVDADERRKSFREQLNPEAINSTKRLGDSDARRIATLASEASLDVAFDVACVGFVPKLRSDQIETAVRNFRHLDPYSPASSSADGASAMESLTRQQSATAAIIAATLQSLSTIDQNAAVLTAHSFMDAFDDFASHARAASENMGAPVAFRTREVTLQDVVSALQR